MCNRYLGFLLLIWCPGELHAQSATQSCSAPSLDGGKFSPKRETYAHGTYVTYSCDLGRKPAVEGWWARSTCQNGTWSPQPRCIRSADACDAPPKIPNAVIVDHGYQELFAADTQLQYECEDGYTAEGAGNDKTIVCIAGTWTEGPTCRTGGGNTTSAGSGTPPAGGGSSSSSGSNTGDTERRLTSVEICGDPPKIPKAVVVRTFRRSVKYGCQQYYKLLGPESVRCYSDGTWSELPSCEASFCVVNTLEYPDLKPAGEIYLEDGETVRLECVDQAEWWFKNYSDGECDNGIIHLSRCCAKGQLAFNTCEGFLTKRN